MDSERAFFSVFTNHDLLKYITSFQGGKKWKDIYYASWVCKHGHFTLLKEMKDLIFDRDTFAMAIYSGRMDVVQWLYPRLSDWYTVGAMNSACQFGQLEIARWLHQEMDIALREQLLQLATTGGFLDVVEWLDSIGAPYTNRCFSIAAEKGYIYLLEWFKSQNKQYNGDLLQYACISGNIKTVQWVLENTPLQLDKECFASIVKKRGTLELFQFVSSQRKHTLVDLQSAIDHGNIEVANYMARSYKDARLPINAGGLIRKNNIATMLDYESRGFLLCWFGITTLGKDGSLESLKWLYKNNHYIDIKECTLQAVSFSHIHVLEWLISIYGREVVLSYVENIRSIKVLKYLTASGETLPFKVEIWPDDDNMKDVQWLYDHGYLKDFDKYLHFYTNHDRIDFIKWMYLIRGEEYLDKILEYALKNGSIKILEWIYTYHRKMDFSVIEFTVVKDYAFTTIFMLRRYYNNNTPSSIYRELLEVAMYHCSYRCNWWLTKQVFGHKQ